ncbi:MAG: hypothetical protein QQN63_11030 [Nitrosopumilus sp.]
MRKLARQLTDDDLEVCVSLYQDGCSLNQIADIFGTSREWMRHRVMLYAHMRQQGRYPKRKARPLSKGDTPVEKRLYNAYGHATVAGYVHQQHSVSKLAKMLSLRVLDVRNLLREREIPLRRKTARRSTTASHKVQKALKTGRLRRRACTICGLGPKDDDGKTIVIAHHNDYNFPLRVTWFCYDHHQDWHRHNVAIMEGEPSHDSIPISEPTSALNPGSGSSASIGHTERVNDQE